ncbi:MULTISPECIES: nitroreductase family protein [unclassified Desulfovibrio]|uniref:nitroreductase family protein n=1 Tax=unclassified Desulfovibrio TaxID=2593640 RepID=UPI0013EB0018|nr:MULTISPECIES: nitroreductase family protein [unclassified Desulfovibrio]
MAPVTFHVDADTCVRCGLCIKDCLFKIIEMGEVPFIDQENREKCIHCGHCQAICPTASITLDGHDPHMLEAAEKPLAEAQVRALIHGRRSVREYQREDVDDALLERIIRMCCWAPTGSNNRGVGYIVFNGRAKVEQLLQATLEIMDRHGLYPAAAKLVAAGNDQVFRGAPCVLLTHAPAQLLAGADCATALAALELALPSFGLASCWAGIFTRVCDKGLPAGLSLPEGHRLYGGLMIGKPAVSYKRVPFRPEPSITWM